MGARGMVYRVIAKTSAEVKRDDLAEIAAIDCLLRNAAASPALEEGRIAAGEWRAYGDVLLLSALNEALETIGKKHVGISNNRPAGRFLEKVVPLLTRPKDDSRQRRNPNKEFTSSATADVITILVGFSLKKPGIIAPARFSP